MNIFTLLLTQPLANGLALYYKLLGQNMGIAIIAFSLTLRFILNPLTKPYMQSMKKIKDHSADLEKLKARHKGDRTKLMKAQADFYKEKGINPGAGCLPYLLQIIVLIAMFSVFSNVLRADGNIAEKFNTMLYEPLKFHQGEQIHTRFLYLDITKPDIIKIPSIPFSIPGPLVLIAAFVQFLSIKITTPYLAIEKKIAKKTPGQEDDIQVAMQSSMVYTFPLLTLVAGLSFPSGIALYWCLFSMFQVYQQYSSSGWGGLTPWVAKLKLLVKSN